MYYRAGSGTEMSNWI